MSLKTDALLDSNVIIAALTGAHEHHLPSVALFASGSEWRFAVAAHSYAEAYNTLTRSGAPPLLKRSPAEAWAALESIRAATVLLGLTAAQTFDAIKSYAAMGGVGARLYDRLIGETAVAHGVPAIATWNVAHMRGLFPRLTVVTPMAFAVGGGL